MTLTQDEGLNLLHNWPNPAPRRILDRAEVQIRNSRVMRVNEPKAASLLLFVALLATGSVYAPSLWFGFVDDDHSQVVDNPRIRNWHEVPGYFTSNVWAHLTPVIGDLPPPFYRPLFLVWLFTNYQLFGTDPAGWHLATVLLHLLATALAYRLVRAIIGEAVPAALAAMLFGLHPVHVEAVAWISGVPEPLMATALLASMLCYLKGREREDVLPWAAVSVFFFGLALLAKETAIMLPAVLLAYEMTLGADPEKKRPRLRRLAPYAVLALIYLVMRRASLGGTFTIAVPWAVMFLTWPSILWNYLRHLFWPVNLTIVCDLPYVTRLDWRNVILPATAIATLVLAVWIAARRRPAIGFAALWMGLLILPPLYLRGIAAGEIAHDRYLYLPSLGLCVLIAFGMARLRAGGVAVVALTGVAAFGVYRECKPWSDDIALFQHALLVAPDNVRAQRQLALALPAAGRCGDAIPLFDRLREGPEDPRILLGLGACYFLQGRFDEAEPLIQRTITLSPRYQPPYMLLIGMRLAHNRHADAETIWRRAVSVRFGPTDARGLHLLGGQILKARGDLVDAAVEFRLELAGDPESEEAARQLEEVEWTLRHRRTAGQ